MSLTGCFGESPWLHYACGSSHRNLGNSTPYTVKFTCAFPPESVFTVIPTTDPGQTCLCSLARSTDHSGDVPVLFVQIKWPGVLHLAPTQQEADMQIRTWLGHYISKCSLQTLHSFSAFRTSFEFYRKERQILNPPGIQRRN